jgi:hypothetical protein
MKNFDPGRCYQPFSNCIWWLSQQEKAMTEPTQRATKPSAVSYAVAVKSIVATNCSPCHIPRRVETKRRWIPMMPEGKY